MSGKQSKRRRREEARSVPPPRARTRDGRRASPRVLLGALVATAAITLAVVVGVVLTRGSSTAAPVPAHGSLANGLPGADRVHSLFRGIPQRGNVLGSPTAPVTMVEYLDLQCPYCRTFENDALPGLVSRYVRTGKVKIVRRTLAFVGPDSARGRLATIAAGNQGRQFDLIALLYMHQGAENTGWLSNELVTAAAASIPGLEVPRLLAASKSETAKSEASAVDHLAAEAGVASTPTILVGKSGAKPAPVTLASPGDGDTVAEAIERALR